MFNLRGIAGDSPFSIQQEAELGDAANLLI